MRLGLVLPMLLAIAAVADAEPTPVILDLPLGSDIDAAFALAYALASPDIDVRGITTVGDQTDERAWIACRFLTHSGSKKIPVAAGAEPQPKLGIDWQIQYRRHPAPIFNRTQKPEKESAVEWLHRMLKDEKVKPTIAATGPLTNIARLLKEQPADAKRIERIVIVGTERNILVDVAAARAVLRSDIPLRVVSSDAAHSVRLDPVRRDDLFAVHSPLTHQLQTLYELWDHANPGLGAAIAVEAVRPGPRLMVDDARLEVVDLAMLRKIDGNANAEVVIKVDRLAFVRKLCADIKDKAETTLPRNPKNLAKFIDRGAFPAKVHVAENFDTDIEKRWWMSGKVDTKDVPPGGVRCLRGVLTQDFDDRQGNMKTSYRAVVFNPVPGPPMGKNTRLAFRYKLIGTDQLRVQIYSLTNGYHRYLSVRDLPEKSWQSGAIDMTEMCRPDGSGGPLSENERIDDIQFYVDPRAQVLIDDVVLYDAAAADEKRPFPKRILYTAWFDTGKHGKEWLGDFEIVDHQAPRTGKAAKSVPHKDEGGEWIRLDLKGLRRLGDVVAVDFKHLVTGSDTLRVELRHRGSGKTWMRDLTDLPRDRWSASTARFDIGPSAEFADEVRFLATPGQTVTVDDVLVYEP
jgi:Inosine-uridine preferring nucleoside hydrolase